MRRERMKSAPAAVFVMMVMMAMMPIWKPLGLSLTGVEHIALAQSASPPDGSRNRIQVDSEGQQSSASNIMKTGKRKKFSCGVGAQYTVPLAVREDGICDCCNCADEPEIQKLFSSQVFESACASVHQIFDEWIEARSQVHFSGAHINRKYKLDKDTAEVKLAYFSDLAASAGEAAQEYVSQYKQLSEYLRTETKIQDAANAMKALERSYFYAKEASLQYALMDGLSKTNFGPSYILMNFLFMNCTRSEPMSEKTLKGGTTNVIPREYTFRFCPFYNVTQLDSGLRQWKEQENEAKSINADDDIDSSSNPEQTNLGYWLGNYVIGHSTYTQIVQRAFQRRKGPALAETKEPWGKWLHQIQKYFSSCFDTNQVESDMSSAAIICYNWRNESISKAKLRGDDPLLQLGIDPFSPIEGDFEGKNISETGLGNYLVTERIAMIYEHGDSCGKGMERSTRIKFVCDDGSMLYRDFSRRENGLERDNLPYRILDVREDGKCDYYITVGTSFSCNLRTGYALKDLVKSKQQARGR